MLLGATFKRGKDTEMSKGRKDCHWKQHSKEEKTPKFPLADRAVTGSNVQKRKGHRNVQRWKRLSLDATFKRGEDTRVSMGGRSTIEIIVCRQAKLCRLAVELILGACVHVSKLLKTSYYRSSSQTQWTKTPLGANERSQAADAPRDLACPNWLSVAREKLVVVKVGVAQKGNRERVNELLKTACHTPFTVIRIISSRLYS
jgi:hypothetical protein